MNPVLADSMSGHVAPGGECAWRTGVCVRCRLRFGSIGTRERRCQCGGCRWLPAMIYPLVTICRVRIKWPVKSFLALEASSCRLPPRDHLLGLYSHGLTVKSRGIALHDAVVKGGIDES